LAVLGAHIDTLADKKSAAALREEIAGMSRLVGQLLRIAELDALDRAPDDPVDLHALAIEVASSLAPLALKERKSIALTGAPGPAWVRGDGEALHQALRNLVENALSHTPKGTTVEITLDADGRVEVTDAGPGVPAELRDKIFQRFFRVDRRTDGAGLGLAIVAKVAETHGGNVRVENAVGGGARFVLELPPTAAPAPARRAS
jgi:signal transduction histidine kinase